MTTLDVLGETAAALHARRAYLSLDVLAGDEAASAELAEVEAELAALHARAELVELAEHERARRDSEQAEQDERERREQAPVEADRLEARRAAALLDVQQTLAQLTGQVQTFTRADAVYRDAAVAAGRRYQAVPLAEIAVVALQDGGLKADGEPLGYVRASVRNNLRQQYPPPERTALTLEPVHIGQCSICTHEHRGVIEGALRNGSSYRELEASFGISKAALSRHVAHARSA